MGAGPSSPTPALVPLGSCSLPAVDTTSQHSAGTWGDSAQDPDMEPGEPGGREPPPRGAVTEAQSAASGYRLSWEVSPG